MSRLAWVIGIALALDAREARAQAPAAPAPPPRPPAAAPAAAAPAAAAPAVERPRSPDAFCEPGLEIRCSCGPNHWEKTRCRDDGTNWEFCPCPDVEQPRLRLRPDRPSARSTGMIAGGVTLAALGAIALGIAPALKVGNVPDCRNTVSGSCVQGWIGVAGTGIVLTATGVPLFIVGAAKSHADDEPRSTGLMVLGSLLAGFGTVALAGGATTVAVGEDLGWAPAIAGSVCVAGGVALAIYGGWEVPARRAGDDRAAAPAILIGPTSASLRWTF